MRRLLTFSLVLGTLAAAYACSSSDSSSPPPGPEADATPPTEHPDTSTGPQTDGGPGTDADAGGDAAVPTGNPIEGIAAPTMVLDTLGDWTDGPTWHSQEGVLYFTTPLGPTPSLVRLVLDGGTTTQVRTGEGEFKGPIGSTVDKNGTLVLAEGDKVTRVLPDGGGYAVVMSSVDAGGTASPVLTPNDLVARPSDNMIWVTDPAYFDGTAATNRIYRIAPNGVPAIVFDDTNLPRPNGVALTKDEKTLYVSFTEPPGGVGYIQKYAVAADGTLGAGTKFTDTGAGSKPDGLAVDEAGNLYVALINGVSVFKPTAEKWGEIKISLAPADDGVTGVAFGGTAKKTLFVTTQKGKIWSVDVKVAGLSQ